MKVKGTDILEKIASLLEMEQPTIRRVPFSLTPIFLDRRSETKAFVLKSQLSPYGFAYAATDADGFLKTSSDNRTWSTLLFNCYDVADWGYTTADVARSIMAAKSLEDLGDFGARLFSAFIEAAADPSLTAALISSDEH